MGMRIYMTTPAKIRLKDNRNHLVGQIDPIVEDLPFGYSIAFRMTLQKWGALVSES
jgi:hypothetical protein